MKLKKTGVLKTVKKIHGKICFSKNQLTHHCHYHFTLFQIQNFKNDPFVFK